MQVNFVDETLDKTFLATLPELEKEIFDELDIYLDGNTYKPMVSDMERKVKEEYRPNLLDAFTATKTYDAIKSGKILSQIINLVICILLDLNPNNNFDDTTYEMRIAILAMAVLTGCVKTKNNSNANFVKKENIDAYYKEVLAKYKNKDKNIIKNITKNLNIAFNFTAFSVINFIRFNHHFPSEKKHLIKKALAGLGEDEVKKYMREENLNSFYNGLVSAVKVINDNLYFRTFIKKIHEDGDTYNKLSKTALMNFEISDEIVKIRNDPTPNGFIITDIVYQIIMDISNKMLLPLVPNFPLFKRILEIRNEIKSNPFKFHPSRFHFGYKEFSDEYVKLRNEFLSIMSTIGSFVYLYSETMYSSIAEAKCREKYQDKIRKEDEVIVKTINSVYSAQYEIKNEKIQEIRENLHLYDINVMDMDKILENNNKLNEELRNVLKQS